MSRPLRIEYEGAFYHITARVKPSGDVVYYFTIRKPGSQEKWKTGIMEKPCYGFRVTGCGSDPRQAHRAWRIGYSARRKNFQRKEEGPRIKTEG